MTTDLRSAPVTGRGRLLSARANASAITASATLAVAVCEAGACPLAASPDFLARALARNPRMVPNSHRYRLTTKGHLLTAALFAARQASLKSLLAAAE